MRWRWHSLLLLSMLSLAITLGAWPWLGGFCDMQGFALGLRRCGEFEPVCGVYGFHGDELDDLWQKPTDEAWYLGGGPLVSRPYRRLLGFSLMAWFPTARDWYFVIGFPFWFVGSVSSIGAFYCWQRLQRQRIRPGFCRSCGYDLRASVDRCPECGQSFC